MKLSLRERIIEYVKKQGGYVHKGVIADRAREAGYSSENSGRRCRELTEDGIFEAKEFKGLVHYKYIPQEKKVTYHEVIEDENGRRAVIREKTITV